MRDTAAQTAVRQKARAAVTALPVPVEGVEASVHLRELLDLCCVLRFHRRRALLLCCFLSQSSGQR